VFRDVEELIAAIGDYIDKHNDNPKPFVWTAKASDILEKVKRARATLDNRWSACRTPLVRHDRIKARTVGVAAAARMPLSGSQVFGQLNCHRKRG
jgi:hypothetical protein